MSFEKIPTFTVRIARVSQDAIAAYGRAIGITPPPPWEEMTDAERAMRISLVEFRLLNPSAPISSVHEKWLEKKEKEGWKYGHEYDPETKTHPLLCPFESLLPFQKTMCRIMAGVIDAMRAEG